MEFKNIRIANWWYFSIGILVFIILVGSYFIQLDVGDSRVIVESSLLGVLIFYSPVVLGIYVLIGAGLIFLGLNWKQCQRKK